MSTDTDTPAVSIILPVYNERGHIEEEIDRVRRSMDESEFSYEIIVVDDGSTDGTGDLVREIDGVRLIQFADNRGSGSSRRIGTNAARGEIVVWSDADMSYPNDRMPQLIRELDGVDQVVGARTSEKGTAKALRVPAKWMIRKLASYLMSTPIPDLNSGFRAMRRSVAAQFLHLLPSGFSCVTTITMTFLNNGYSVKYVPIEYAERAGDSKFHWYRDTKRYLLQVVRLIMMYNPLRVLMPTAVFLFSVGGVKLVYDLVTKNFRPAANTLLIFSAAFAVVLVAVLADLVVQVSKPQHSIEPASVYRTQSLS